jgi:hypothetical protein
MSVPSVLSLKVEGAGAGAMLVAFRLAGLSAPDFDYAVGGAGGQSG